MKEVDLAARVVAHYRDGFEVFQEVGCGGGIIDIVLRCGPLIVGIECKMTFGLDVIEQAHRNRHYCHHSYVAVPSGRTKFFAREVCAEYGIGILVVDMYDGRVHQQGRPKMNRRVRGLTLADFQKDNVAGVVNGRKTAFGHTVEQLVALVRSNPGITMKDAVSKIDHHYGKDSNATAALCTWIRRGVIKGVHYEKRGLVFSEPA